MPALTYTDGTPKANPDWFAFRVKPRHEKTIAWQLKEKEEDCFLPLVRRARTWGNRVCHVDLPLIPGYVFCRTAQNALLGIVKTPGVIDVVRIGRNPAPIKSDEIRALQLAIGAYNIEPCNYFEVGRTVEIRRGPLAGVSGTVVEVRNKQHLILSVSLLRRSVIVHLDLAATCDDEFIARNTETLCCSA